MTADHALYARRALRAYAAMRATFRGRRSLYRHDARLRSPLSTAHLWPFARAFVATLDVAGMPPDLIAGFDAGAAIDDHLAALTRYWDPTHPEAPAPPAYSSDVIGAGGLRLGGGDRYYDDNAWVGLALVQLERLRPGAGMLPRAEQLWAFAVGGWDRRPDAPCPGGIFWVEQGRGLGARNHDRNTVSTAPNAQLALHLTELTGRPPPAGSGGEPTPRQMYEWVNAALDAGGDGTGLFWDKIRGDGTIDRTQWSYNQGNMVGLNVLLYRAGGDPVHLARAEAIARSALQHFDAHHAEQPPAFHAILFRNLLLLHARTSDADLRARIVAALTRCADLAGDRPDRPGRPTLLDQSALVQMLALLAWDPAGYDRLA